jgi:hypothetical protein
MRQPSKYRGPQNHVIAAKTMGYLLACDVHYDLINHGAMIANYQEGA